MILPSIFFATLAAAAVPSDWETARSSCSGLAVPEIHNNTRALSEKMAAGQEWSVRMQRDQGDLDRLTRVSCPAYLANPNGDTSLASFRTEFQKVAQQIADTRAQALVLRSFLLEESKTATKFFSQFAIEFGSSSCGRTFLRIGQEMAKEELKVQAQLGTLLQKCSAISSEETERLLAAVKARREPEPFGTRPAPTTVKKSPRQESTITGVKEKPSP